MRHLSVTFTLLTLATVVFGQTSTPPPVSPEQSAPMTVEIAHSKLLRGQEREVIEALQKLGKFQPRTAGVNRELGLAYYRIGKLADAEESFAAAIAEDAGDLQAVQLRGLTLYRLGRPGAALPFLERARQGTPDSNVDVNYVLGRCYIGAGRYDDARTAFAVQYDIDPKSGSAYLVMAQILLNIELPELAEENARKALDNTPNIALAHFMLGKIYLAKGDTKSAFEQFEQERNINPTYPPLYQFLGDLYIQTNQHQEAQHSLTKALSLDQTSTGPFILMGRLFLNDNDPQSAASYLEHAEQMDSSNFIIHYLLGQAYRQMGRREDAKRELEVVSKRHSSDSKSLQ